MKSEIKVREMFATMTLKEKIEWVCDKFYDRVYTFEFPLLCKDSDWKRKEINEFIEDRNDLMDVEAETISEIPTADYIYFDEVDYMFYEFNLNDKHSNEIFDSVFLDAMVHWEVWDDEEETEVEPF